MYWQRTGAGLRDRALHPQCLSQREVQVGGQTLASERGMHAALDKFPMHKGI